MLAMNRLITIGHFVCSNVTRAEELLKMCATTLSTTTLSITTLSIMTFSITTFSITTIIIMTFSIVISKT
jgi:hypothetical protein